MDLDKGGPWWALITVGLGPLDFGGNADNVTLVLRVTVTASSGHDRIVTWRLFNCKLFFSTECYSRLYVPYSFCTFS